MDDAEAQRLLKNESLRYNRVVRNRRCTKLKTMKLANIIYPVFSIMFSLCLFSCNNDDDDYNGGGGNSENRNDYTVTESVKTANLIEGYNRKKYDIIIYEDFNYRYSLLMTNGRICLKPEYRYNGYFTSKYDDSGTESGIHDTGKVNNLQSITEKEKINDDWERPYPSYSLAGYQYSDVQPGHGYSVYFTTDEGEMKFVRIYIKDYTLDESGILIFITIQYQLY